MFLKRLDPLHLVLLRIEARLMRGGGARKVTAISKRGGEEIRRHFGIEKVPVIYNGVDPEEFYPPKEDEKIDLRDELKIPKESFVVLYVGSGFFRKGLRYLINGFALLSAEEWRNRQPLLLVAGRGKTKPYEQLARSLGVKFRFPNSFERRTYLFFRRSMNRSEMSASKHWPADSPVCFRPRAGARKSWWTRRAGSC
jgi:glycosyltransferase involved in cell wall biosynthesis